MESDQLLCLPLPLTAGEGLFVEQADQAVLDGDLLHHLHGQLVVVGGDVDVGKHRGQFVLRRRGLVVLGAGEDAQFPQFLIQFAHEGGDARLQSAEILVVHLLTLGGAGAEERAAGVFEVRPALVNGAVDEEILLLRPDGGVDAAHVLVAKETQHALGLAVERLHRAQKRRLFVQHAARIGIKRRGDAERIVLDKSVAGGVPGGIAAGLERGAQAARGKDEASGSPLTSSLPENSMTMLHDPVGVKKASCFSAVTSVSGWNQWVKCVAPLEMAQSFMALATTSATLRSRSSPSWMVFCSLS